MLGDQSGRMINRNNFQLKFRKSCVSTASVEIVSMNIPRILYAGVCRPARMFKSPHYFAGIYDPLDFVPLHVHADAAEHTASSYFRDCEFAIALSLE